MRPVATVALSVCQSVCHFLEPCKNGWSYRDAIIGIWTWVGTSKQC